MALIEWNESFLVGVKAMDDQHRGLANALNELHAAMKAGKAKEVTGPLLTTLVKYTRDHFTAEEALMNRHSSRPHRKAQGFDAAGWGLRYAL